MAKVMFAFPPIKDAKGYPTASQNRQFQWFRDPTFVYPIIPATCATMLACAGQQIAWVDAIAEEMNDVEFGKIFVQLKPDYVVFEANTPLFNRYAEIIKAIKQQMPDTKVILAGEHPTAFPIESKDQSNADYVVQGGKWYRKVYNIITGQHWDKKKELPFIDRNLTRWWLYGYKNGNFKYIPATYIMSAQDCWYRKCQFCSWAEYHEDYYLRSVDNVLQEVENLIVMGFKEIFDDSGTFPTGEWLREFCKGMIERGYNKHIAFSCNMRFGSLDLQDFKLMKDAGFRMILWGLESVNQETLDRLEKGYRIEQVNEDLLGAKGAGLSSHLTCMFGYPWEEYEDAKRTYDRVRWYLLQDWAFSAQATICIPYPKTKLWNYCKENGFLRSEDWDDYDMTKPIMEIPYPDKELSKFQKGIYNVSYHPKFLWNKLKMVRNMNDLKYYLRIGRKIYDRFGNWYEIDKVGQD